MSTTTRSTQGLLRHAAQRATATRRKITKAIRDMHKQGLAINPNAVARHAGVARKTIYNHPEILEQIRAMSTKPHLRPATPQLGTGTGTGTGETSIVTALREQLRAQKHHHHNEITELKTQIKTLQQALAAAHGQLHQLNKTATTDQH